MLIGVNWTSPHNYKVIKDLAGEGDVDFCEILIDNFLHYDPCDIKKSLPTRDCSFHIMNSHFLEKDREGLHALSDRIKKCIDVLDPLYVSDHIGKFYHNGRKFPFMQEVSYKDVVGFFEEKAQFWSDLLGCKVYYENFPSFEKQNPSQLSFFDNILASMGSKANVLFDISNAIVNQLNTGEQASEWYKIFKNTKHFHVGGYQKAGDTKYFLDSHDRDISSETLDFIKKYIVPLDTKETTLVIERDYNIEFNSWLRDIRCIRGLFRKT